MQSLELTFRSSCLDLDYIFECDFEIFRREIKGPEEVGEILYYFYTVFGANVFLALYLIVFWLY